ncbi:TrbI/VirB10 family protein [Legionella sp. 16cNR16C]|uniref:TrbI/VirB10 family protein n=1 Tax=Legionella sp. 16cNR16C TaxID=2905656 RepID=UPI001E5D2D83|nr:TrbI/VirB10 family protein [Legionella sp. 16cNR16C]MCE3043971.1 TrbI/VirB10 family protein [Legionella sp. 16cNR16C]
MQASDKNNDERLSELSQVTPPKKTWLGMNARIAVTIGVSVTLLGYAFIPKHAQSVKTDEPSSHSQGDYTLSQNLELIEKMKAEAAKPITNSEKNASYSKPIKPPKLRHKDHLSKEMLARMNAPTTFLVNRQAASGTIAQGSPGNANAFAGNNPNTQFLNQQNEITSVVAKKLPHPAATVPAGEMIAATLETAINSELPGMARAITMRDIYSLEGQHCLIPKGSVLVGQFDSQVVDGQSRILVVWNRIQLANGVIVSLNSPSTDAIGRSGQGADYINRHFVERFGTSALLSILGAYTATSGVNGQDQYNSEAQYRTAIASSFQQTAGQAVNAGMAIRPTLQVNQGSLINVFVAHDLDFFSVKGGRG